MATNTACDGCGKVIPAVDINSNVNRTLRFLRGGVLEVYKDLCSGCSNRLKDAVEAELVKIGQEMGILGSPSPAPAEDPTVTPGGETEPTESLVESLPNTPEPDEQPTDTLSTPDSDENSSTQTDTQTNEPIVDPTISQESTSSDPVDGSDSPLDSSDSATSDSGLSTSNEDSADDSSTNESTETETSATDSATSPADPPNVGFNPAG